MVEQLWARLDGITVAETWPHDFAAKLPAGVSTPIDAFGEEFGGHFVPCPADVRQFWTSEDGGKTFAAPAVVVPPPPRREAYGDDLQRALTDAEIAALSTAPGRDQRMLSAQRAPFVETDPTIVSTAQAMKIEPRAWFDRLFAAAAAA